METSKAQEEDGSSENEQLDTDKFGKPKLLFSSVEVDDENQADAGSDAYDRDFALNLLSQEQDALYEIEEALKRFDAGTYGICEMSGKPIPQARLEAIPFARFTVECQTQIEKRQKSVHVRQSVKSLFGLTDDDSAEGEEDTPIDSKD
jgi:DnaK suppressor protein